MKILANLAKISSVAKTCCFCVDGTNVVRGAFGYGGPQFRDQEEADSLRLVQALAGTSSLFEGRVELEVFFDGGRRPWPASALPANIRVRFTDESQADDLILDLVRARRHANGGKVTVVTADGELGGKVSEEGARWLRVRPGASLEAVVGAIEGRLKR